MELFITGSFDVNKEWEFLSSCQAENGFTNNHFGCSLKEYINEIVPACNKASKGIDLPEGYVPQSSFYLVDDNQIVGLFYVRHYVNEITRHNGAGHIGYYMKKEYRNRGYAKAGLKLAIEKLRQMDDYDPRDGIIMGCHKDNIASLKVQQSCGAKIIDETEIDYITKI